MPDSDSERDPLEQLADDFAQRYRRGERPTLTEYAQKCPELAGEIRELFPALVEMEQLRPAAAGAEGALQHAAAAVHDQPEQLGDYRILREVARGGMGVVYEAVQESLGRHVALKVLPLHGLMNPTQRERFRREARAAARLHHSNIVPVFGVGEDRGIHYYAMQFIQGQSLDQVLHELRRLRGKPNLAGGAARGSWARSAAYAMLSGQFSENDRHKAPQNDRSAGAPSSALSGAAQTPAARSELGSQSEAQYYRSVAQLGVQVADALAYAHDQGILHRDIKPSNLLLDTHGTAWVTDFGLAKDEESDELTHSGDIVGTLRYMAPERFEGRSDARSDVYGLGITLYEALTLEPAFDAKDRAELLRRISHEPPPMPRRINRTVPPDLETIVLKATAIGADERYAGAGELAEDLRRFLQDRPILARRPTLAQRAAKWARRHQPLVWTAVVLLCVIALGSTVSTLLIAEQRNAAEQAAQRERSAARQAQVQEARAEGERDRAEHHFRLARDAVDRMFTRVAEQLRDVPHMQQTRRALLEDALEFYQAFLQEKSTDTSVRHDTARAYMRVAEISAMLGRTEPWEQTSRKAIALLEELAAEFPAHPEYRVDLADCHARLAMNYFGAKKEKAVALRRKELALREKLAVEFPQVAEYRRRLAFVQTDLGNALDLQTAAGDAERTSEKEMLFRAALANLEELQQDFPERPVDLFGLSHAHCWLGWFLLSTDRPAEAERHLRQAHAMREQLVAQQPEHRGWQAELAHAKQRLGAVLVRNGKPVEAELFCRQAIDLHEKLIDDFPDVVEHRQWLRFSYRSLADCLLALGRTEEAECALRRHVELFRKLVTDSSIRANWKDVAWANYKLALLLDATDQAQGATEAFREAISMMEKHIAVHPETVRYRNQLGWMLVTCPSVQLRDPERAVALAQYTLEREPRHADHWSLLGIGQYRLGDFIGAIESLNQSMELSEGGGRLEWAFLAMAHWQLGRKQEAMSWYRQAERWREERPYDNLEAQNIRAEVHTLMSLDEDKPPTQDTKQRSRASVENEID